MTSPSSATSIAAMIGEVATRLTDRDGVPVHARKGESEECQSDGVEARRHHLLDSCCQCGERIFKTYTLLASNFSALSEIILSAPQLISP